MSSFKHNLLYVISLAVMFLAASAIGDWDPGGPYKMHYPKLPDLTTAGMDVLAGPLSVDNTGQVYWEKFLADDFLCTESGPITDIHIWCSYRGDTRYMVPPEFSLVIYDHVPTGPGGPDYSQPGAPLWDAYVRPTVERIYAEDVDESFYDPSPDEIVDRDTVVWQYNFKFSEDEAFHQERGKIYWLAVKHTFDLSGNGTVDLVDVAILASIWPSSFGWKTSVVEQYEDAAVWTDVMTYPGDPHVHVVPTGPWRPLDYPDVHEYAGQPIDLAFVIAGPQVDFGDAPRPYPTKLAVDGARHMIGGPYFCDAAGGDSPDPEGDGQPHLNALGDDNDGSDDEDGVQIPLLTVGVASNISLMV